MGVIMIRVLVLTVSTAFLLAPVAAYACAQHEAHTARAATTDLAAKAKPVQATTDSKGGAAQTTPTK